MYKKSAENLGLDPRGVPRKTRNGPVLPFPSDVAGLNKASIADEEKRQKDVGKFFNETIDRTR